MTPPPQTTYQADLNLEYLKRLGEEADLVVRERTLPFLPMYLLFFAAIFFATPISKRIPAEMILFGALNLVLVAVRLGLAVYWKKFLPDRKKLWHRLSALGIHVTALFWGIFTCFAVAKFELGWTSFFVILMSIALCAGTVPALSPKLSLLKWNLLLMLLPSVVANLVYVGGLRGFALSAFYAGFFALLMIQGRIQNREYWRGVQDNARLHAMIDALPGTISWISSNLNYLGANRQLSDFLRLEPDQIIGTPVGGIEKESGFRHFMERFFASDKDKDSIELRARTSVAEKAFFLVARKYKQNTEALVLGMDITDYKKSVEEHEHTRTQSLYSAKMASLGEIVASLSDEIGVPLHAIEKTLSMLSENPQRTRFAIDRMQRMTTKVIQLTTVLNRFLSNDNFEAVSRIRMGELIHDTLLLCTERYALAQIPLKVNEFDANQVLECQPTQILIVLLNLLLNAYDIAKNAPEKWVKIDIQVNPDGVDISVTDSGPGIPEEVKKRLFEPLFTTKKSGTGTGVGLSISRMIVEKHSGRLWIDSQSPNTRFVISLPCLLASEA